MIIAFFPGAGGNRFLQRMLNKEWSSPDTSYDDVNIDQAFEHRYLLGAVPNSQSGYVLTHCMNSKKLQQTFPGQPVTFIKSDLCCSLQREWTLNGHKRFEQRVVDPVVSKLEHYQAVRDPSWPQINSEAQLAQLPLNIQIELNRDYEQVMSGVPMSVPHTLVRVTKTIVSKINSSYEIITWHRDYYQQYPVDFSGASQVIDINNDNSDFCMLMRQELNRYHSDLFQQVWNAVNE